MACVFGEMRTLKMSERWWVVGAQNLSRLGRFPGIAVQRCVSVPAWTAGECRSHPLCRVQPIAFHQSRAPVYSPCLNNPCILLLSQPTTSPQCLALTRSHSTRSHTVPFYLVLILSHVRFRTSCHIMMVTSSINVSHRLALFPIHLTVCRVTGRFDTEPRTVRRTIQRTGSTHCCCYSRSLVRIVHHLSLCKIIMKMNYIMLQSQSRMW